MNILYEDKHILVAVKPVGYLSEPGGSKSFPDALSAYLREKGEKDEIFTVHRLDKNVGGVMVFARTQKAASLLTQAVAARQVEKEYLYGGERFEQDKKEAEGQRRRFRNIRRRTAQGGRCKIKYSIHKNGTPF